MSKSWMQLLTIHRDQSMVRKSQAGLFRSGKAKAWLTLRAWSGPAARIRWAGACGHFEGRIRED